MQRMRRFHTVSTTSNTLLSQPQRYSHLEIPLIGIPLVGVINRSFSSVSYSSLSGSLSALKRGRAEVADTLCLLGSHQFCPRGVSGNVHYDVVSLDHDIGGGVLLTTYGEVCNPSFNGPELDHILSVDQSFVLHRNGVGVTEDNR